MEAKKHYDPRMHSAEHILNQTMIRKFGCNRSFNNHIERKKSKCDYHFERSLAENELREIETEINRIVQANLPVTEEFLPKSEAMSLFNLEKLPEETGDQVRIIRIGDYDSCPCIGPHVKNTGEIGIFRLISADFNEGVLRIRYKLAEA